MMRRALSFAFLGLAGFSSAVQFDFENLAATYNGAGSRPGGYTSASQTVDGVTLSIARTQGAAFDVYGFTSPDPYAGRRFLDGFSVSPERPFVFDFSVPLSQFSILIGQFQAAPPRNAVLRAYSGAGGTGTLLMELTGTIPISSSAYGPFAGVVLTVNGAAIRSVTATANGSFNNAFLDNGVGTVAPVPEPASMVALGLGAAALMRRRKRA